MQELTNCPYCHGEFIIKEVECAECHTQIKGNFASSRMQTLNTDDLLFIELFVKNEGNIKLMEKDLGVSYPTVKNRLKNIIAQLGYNSDNNPTERLDVLQALSDGKISAKEAINKIKKK